MGLDAQVFCDCIEKGRLRTPHPFPERLYVDVDEDGRPEVRVNDLPEAYSVVEQAHDEWLLNSPCEHGKCVLVAHYLGNIGLVAALRGAVDLLLNDQTDVPVLRQKVIYSGIHCGDRLNRDQVELLAPELRELEQRDWSKLKRHDAALLRDFITQMNELIAASRSVEKPIAF